MSVLRVVARNKVVQIRSFERICFEREVLVHAEVVDPQHLGPGCLAGRFPIKEKNIRLYALRVENPSGKPEQGMHIAFMQEFTPNRLTSTALEKHVVRNHDRGAAVNFEQCFHMLDEVQLLVTGRSPEVVSHHRERLFLLFPFFVDHQNAGFLATIS